MNHQQIRYELERLLQRYRLLRLIEAGVMGIAVGIVVYAVAQFALTPLTSALVATAIAMVTCVLRIRQLRLFQIDAQSMASYVNRQLPQLQESGDLLLRDAAGLTMLEKLQQARVSRQFSDLSHTVRLPHQLRQALLALVGCSLIATVIIVAFSFQPESGQASTSHRRVAEAKKQLPASVSALHVRIATPRYTKLGEVKQQTFPISAPERSFAHWLITFSAPADDVQLIFDGKDTLDMKPGSDGFTGERELNASGFYQLAWRSADGVSRYSDFYAIQVRPDTPPLLKIEHPDQFVQLEASTHLTVDVKATLSDDYGIADAYLIATVSKGSGEGIKFREERLRFDSPRQLAGKQITAVRRIDLIKLGLDPGDELYYYVEAFDNQYPERNRARTETYFISVKDTAEISTSIDPGLGVDLMPEYFRSQRQIIIDSEKLLKEKGRISREQFNARSNELAHDEKVLRLRYGEFLGEEFETSIGPSAGFEPAAASDADIMKQYGHQHDTDEEHAARVETPAHQTKSDDHHKHGATDKNSDPAKEYMHAHDSEEEATFFTQSIRAKLKAAITIMWDAELHLRLYTPEKSLPYQYRALKLLKEISQDSRIYVHRTGFDPPPIKEEKRLSGDLAEIKSSAANSHNVAPEVYPAIQRALRWVETEAVTNPSITADVKEQLQQAGAELSGAALRQPGRYLDALSLLRSLADNAIPENEREAALRTIRATFYQVLPERTLRPSRRNKTTHALDDAFLEKYDALPKDLSR